MKTLDSCTVRAQAVSLQGFTQNHRPISDGVWRIPQFKACLTESYPVKTNQSCLTKRDCGTEQSLYQSRAWDFELIKHSAAFVRSSLGSLSVPMYSLKKSRTFLIFGVRSFGLQYKATSGIGEGDQPGKTWTSTLRKAGALAIQSGRTTIPTPSNASCLETTGSPVVT
jgi:hypothetical protein